MLDAFTKAYIECMMFTNAPKDNPPVPLIDPETMKVIKKDCKTFQEKCHNEIHNGLGPIQAGHDFWLTRNGHGAGFSDGDWGINDSANHLYLTAREFGEFNTHIEQGVLHHA